MANRYDELDKTALQILMDYSDGEFPIDLEKLCERLRIKLTPYSALKESAFSEINSSVSNGELSDGFSIILNKPDPQGYVAYAYYNDDKKAIISNERVRFTIAHEIKHVIFRETNPTNIEESEAEHFARFLLAPMPLLIVGKYETNYEIRRKFRLTKSAAYNALKAKNNRVEKHGNSLFKYESNFIDWFLENAKKGRRSGEGDATQNYDSSVSSSCYSPGANENQQNKGGYNNADIQ